MSEMSQLFRAGELEAKGFSDGMLKTSLDLVLGMERAQSEALAGPTSDGSVFIPDNNFLFRRGGATVLIDEGAGNTMPATLGKLASSLQAQTVAPATITNAILSH